MRTAPTTAMNTAAHDQLHAFQTALHGLKFGSVEITVHNGQVVQIERKEKIRLQQPSTKNS